MPEMDGIEATRRIRSWEQTTGCRVMIAAMTAHAMAEDRERCLEAGMDSYVSKPFQIAELLAVLKQASDAASAGTPPALEAGHREPAGAAAAASIECNSR